MLPESPGQALRPDEVPCVFSSWWGLLCTFKGVLAASLGCLIACSLMALMALSQQGYPKPSSQTSLQHSILIAGPWSKYHRHHPPAPFGEAPSPVRGGHRDSTSEDGLLQLHLESNVSCLQLRVRKNAPHFPEVGPGLRRLLRKPAEGTRFWNNTICCECRRHGI